MPKVSAIICVYNQPLVKDAIESALNQTFADFELIIIDDGSTDQTPEIISAYSSRVKIVRQQNHGVAAARNKGLSVASGEIIAYLDSDDVWLPGYLKEQVAFLDSHPRAGLSFTDGWLLWSQSIPENISTLASAYSLYPLATGPDPARNFFNSPIVTSFTAFRRAYFARAGFFEESLKIHEDADLFLRGLEAGMEFGFLNQPLAIKRSLATGLGSRRAEFFVVSREIQIMSWKRSPGRHPLLRESIPLTDRLIARDLLEQRKYREARNHLFDAVRYRPWAVRTWMLWLLLFLPEPVPTLMLTRNILPPDKKRSYGAGNDNPGSQR